MKALVLYDSVFGNTAKVAQAIGEALKPDCDVVVKQVAESTPADFDGIDILIAGSPTRGFKATPAFNKLLNELSRNALQGVRVGAFDTRMDVVTVDNKVLTSLVKVFGYAAEPTSKRLEKKGGRVVLAPAGFIVKDSEGPLMEGELERAASWARAILKA